MTYAPISLNKMFPIGTIGHYRIYNPLLVQNTNFLLPQENIECKPLSKRRLRKIEKAALDIFDSEIESPNPDEVLRQANLYDSTDKRCCINRKRR